MKARFVRSITRGVARMGLRAMSRSFPRLVLGGGVVLGLGGEPFQIKDMRGELPVSQTRAPYGLRELEAVDMLVCHHSASTAADVYTIADWHVNGNKWPEIGYHFAIDASGTLYVLHDLTTWSWHASGHNHHSVGVVFLGNFETQEPTHEQLQTYDYLRDFLRKEMEVTCEVMHRDLKSTLCPGTKMVLMLREIILDTCIVYP